MKSSWKPTKEMFSNWKGYIWGPLLVVLFTSLGQLVARVFSLENIIMLYLLIVVISAIYWGLGPSIMVSVLIVVALDFFFIPPFLGFIPFSMDDAITLAVLLAISMLIGILATRFRQKSEESRRREYEISTLYTISRDLAKITELESGLTTMMRIGESMLENKVAILLPDSRNKDSLSPYSLDPGFKLSESEFTVANWSLQNRKAVGHDTNSFSDFKSRFMPLSTSRGPIGVMVLWNLENKMVHLTAEQSKLLQAFMDLIAVCIENIKLVEEANKAEVLRAKEKLQTTILNSISHDLRTPLVSVIGVLSSLQEEGMDLNEATRRNLIQMALEDAERLNSLIANLLDISRIEAGAMKLLKQPSDVSELIGATLERMGVRAASRNVEIKLPAELPFINVDSGLIVQVFINILDNAFKYSPSGSSVEIRAQQIERGIEIEIADRGIGFPQTELPFDFEKFHRIHHQDDIYGTGLGLSICKGIIELHGGQIKVENRAGGGAKVKFTLPIAERIEEYGRK